MSKTLNKEMKLMASRDLNLKVLESAKKWLLKLIIPGRVGRKMRQGLFVDVGNLSCHLTHIPFALQQKLTLQILKGLHRIISGFALKVCRFCEQTEYCGKMCPSYLR
jgi:hypothetical protein